MNRNREAVAHLAKRLTGRHGETITYKRSPGAPGELSATFTVFFGREDNAAANPGGQIARYDHTERDVLIPVESLVLSGTAVVPRRGDRIVHTVAGVTTLWDVLPRGDESPWVYLDETRVVYRVHLKRA